MLLSGWIFGGEEEISLNHRKNLVLTKLFCFFFVAKVLAWKKGSGANKSGRMVLLL
jgi:hypothetical protein